MSPITAKLVADITKILEDKYGPMNDAMFADTKSYRTMFFNTAEPRVKIHVEHSKSKKEVDICVSIAVEELNRKGVFFAIGDRLHFNVEEFPEMKFHKDIAAKLTRTSARKCMMFNHDVVAFAKELTEKIM